MVGSARLSGTGDAQTVAQAMKQVGATGPLLGGNQHASTLLLLVAGVVLVVLFGRHPRFRRPPSLLGLLLGLANGYLVGGYALVALAGPAAAVPLPFGLNAAAAAGAGIQPAPGRRLGRSDRAFAAKREPGFAEVGCRGHHHSLGLDRVGGQREGARRPQTRARSRLGRQAWGR